MPRLGRKRTVMAWTGALALAFGSGSLARAQRAPDTADAPSAASPTTRVLAIGRLTKAPVDAALPSIMPTEVRETVALYLAGRIADWYAIKDAPGVVFLLDVDSVDAARALTAGLPLVKAGLMRFELIPLGPLTPLRILTR